MSTDELVRELRSLRRGRGLQAPRLVSRLGPRLRELIDIGTEPDSAVVRRALLMELERQLERLPEPDRQLLRAGLAMAADAAPLLTDRMAAMAARLDCDLRTVQRRINAAEGLLAEQLIVQLWQRRGQGLGDGWYVAALRAHMRLDLPNVVVYEDRRIVAMVDNVQQVTLGFELPAPNDGVPGPRLAIDVRYGGRLLRHDRSLPGQPKASVELPVPLRAGQSHEFGVELRVDAGELSRPHYILTPERRYDEVRLGVRFDPRELPHWVRRVSAETVRMFDPPRSHGEALSLDRAGEVSVSFRRPQLHLGYGIQWGM